MPPTCLKLRCRRPCPTGRAADERWHVKRDGSVFWASGQLTPLRDGGVHGYLKILRDHTEQRLTAERLRASEERFRTLAEGIPQLVWRSRSDGDRTWGSPQWVAYSGLSLEQSVGFGWLDAVHMEDRGSGDGGLGRGGAIRDLQRGVPGPPGIRRRLSLVPGARRPGARRVRPDRRMAGNGDRYRRSGARPPGTGPRARGT